MRKIVTAFDHAGVELREIVHKTISECGCEVIDVGTDSTASVDFPDYAYIAAQKILEKEADKGIFVCGSGVGMSLAANKIKGIYAAVCHDTYSAHQAVEHDDINVLCLGSRVIGPELAHELITAYLNASFNQKENQIRRMNKVRMIEAGSFEPKNNSMRLFENGQSVWLDNIHRGLTKTGKLAKDIEHGMIRGITSNPSIFKNALINSREYDNALMSMAMANVPPEKIYDLLTVEDIGNAADLFRDLFSRSHGEDGFVSLEISPLAAHDTEMTISEAKSLWKAVNRPNLMIKIPVTTESLPAIRELTASGINLNLTLLFSPKRYAEGAQAYIDGLQKRLDNGEPVDNIHSVASIFVSRVDTKADALLSEKGLSAQSLLGKTAIRNAQKIYNESLRFFSSDCFEKIRAQGGNIQKVLWASTGPKNPLYKPTFYTEALIGENTVNTLTPATLEAFMKSAEISKTLPADKDMIDEFFEEIKAAGIDFDSICAQLEEEGVEVFTRDYQTSLDYIRNRCEAMRGNIQGLQTAVCEAYAQFDSESVIRRIFSKDPTVWTIDTQSFAEIRNRLGWLDTFKNTENSFTDYLSLRNELKKEGISRILLLGMGGSSLAPEVMANIFESETDIKLQIIDSTDPLQVREARRTHDPQETLFIVSSKSGGTAEVRALMDYFFEQARSALGEDAGRHFIAITDPGTALEKRAKELGFRQIILADPSVGGRFSALTAFGMVPAVLMGLDNRQISLKVHEIMNSCSASLPAYRNEGTALGMFIGTAANTGKDKLTIVTDPDFSSFGSWLEQLIAESSGKDGKGIVPIDGEPELEDKAYNCDRCFVYLNLNNSRRAFVEKIKKQGHPLFEIAVENKYDLFSEFYRWEIAAAVACSVLYVNAFDQPNVQDSKSRTSAKIIEFHETGNLEEPEASWCDDDVDIWCSDDLCGSDPCRSYNDVVNRFISESVSGTDYIAINAYLPRNREMTVWLQNMRNMILQNTNCATTIGFGPRFQHSTGQLHKGGANNGLFIQITADYKDDIDIPNEDLSFRTLERAQSLGDLESLIANGRRVMRVRFKKGLPARE